MLSEKERLHIENFFEDFPSAELLTLALVISKRNLQPESRQDALKIICQHSECVQSILEKRKIKKSYLSDYLHKHKVSITFSWDKPTLIRKLLDLWDIKEKPSSHNTDVLNSSSTYFEQLSYKFSEWFYSLINDSDPSKLGPEHFFVDSQIKLALHEENNTDVIEAHTSTDVAQSFRDLQQKYKLKFLPNLTPNAIKYQTDIHGQVMLMVSGTLHSSNSNQVVGVFEQMFLLIRDIADNENWKIKNTQIILRSTKNSIQCSSTSSTNNALSVYS